MEIDANLVFAGVGACAVVGGAIMAYGELKTKVVTLTQRAGSADQAYEKIYDKVSKLEEETKVQRVQIDDIRKNNNKLFELVEGQSRTLGEIKQELAVIISKLKSHG
jgi:uncharacterized membrane protein YgaE (UPF0421/DUF939 family)